MALIDITHNGSTGTKYASSDPAMYVANCAACGSCIAREMSHREYVRWGRQSRMCESCEADVFKLRDGNGQFILSPRDYPVKGLRYLVEVRGLNQPKPKREFPANKISDGQSDGLGHLFLGFFVVGMIVGIGIAMMGKP